MKPFLITTPQLRLNVVDDDYFLRDRWMICRDELAKLFDIGESKVISLQLSSEPDEDGESVAIVLVRGCSTVFKWRKRRQCRNTMEYLYFDAGNWLLKRPPFRDMDVCDEITIHVTVYTHG